jgi:hypothetical protein
MSGGPGAFRRPYPSQKTIERMTSALAAEQPTLQVLMCG